MEPPGEFPQSQVPSPVVSEASRVNGQARIVILGLVAALLGGGAVTAGTIGVQRGTAGRGPVQRGGDLVNQTKRQGRTPGQTYRPPLGNGGGRRARAGNIPA